MDRFSKLVASAELRANFIQSTVRFLREHKFDGLDLDWEYPGYRDGSSPDDRHNYAALIKVSNIHHIESTHLVSAIAAWQASWPPLGHLVGWQFFKRESGTVLWLFRLLLTWFR